MKFLRKRLFVVSIGLLLIALLVWYAGPYLAFADYHPLQPVWVRAALIAAIVLAWLAKQAWKSLKSARASAGLATAVARQSAPAAGSADMEQLRQRFEEALAHLRSGKRGVNLYELPWYAIIGAPGSGKTTVLKNSGLHFPLEQKFGRDAMRGVGGTRNCDWWFTEEAVLLDTAGRYTTQDSDQAADSAGWREFLALLVKHRGRRPLNGIILTLSASDLLVQQPGERSQHVAALARRLDEITRELKVRLPVYLMVTKTDLVAGFNEYFDELDHKGRAQVWGVTFPYAASVAGSAAGEFAAEFPRLVARLNARVLARVEQERDPRRRQAIFGFPQQWSTLAEPLNAYVEGLFAAGRAGSQAPLLRGVYFTSGTQEGNPIDRILGALARSLPQEGAVSAPQGPGKSYFIEQLLRGVMFAEAGLAGVNRVAERRRMLLQLGVLAGAALFAVLAIAALSVSYGRNKAYVADVDGAVQSFDEISADGAEDILQGLPRLDALRELADTARQRAGGVPLSMRFGLYQGDNLGAQAEDAYLRELNDFLVPRVAEAIRARLVAYTAEPDKLYEYLKAYIMLGHPEHLDVTQLAYLVDLEWKVAYPGQDNVQQRLDAHLRKLLDERGGLRAVVIDEQIVRQARIAIRQASVARLIYSQLKLDYQGRSGGVVVADSLGLGADTVMVRRSGRPFTEPVSSLYTPTSFATVTGTGSGELVRQFNSERWVLGEEFQPAGDSVQLEGQVLDLYEDDYIAVWRAVLDDYTVVSFRNVESLTTGLSILAGPSSPLRSLFQVVSDNTRLIRPEEKKEEPGITDRAQQTVRNRLQNLLPAASQLVPAAAPRGTKVTAAFADMHQLVGAGGGQARIERVLLQLSELQRGLQSVGTGIGEMNPLDALAQSGSGDAAMTLRQEAATLPPVLAGLVTQVTGHTTAVAVGAARSELLDLYRTEVVAVCNTVARGKYPFARTSDVDVPLQDFGRLFSANGVYATFFQQRLDSFVDRSQRPWRWRSSSGGRSLGLSDAILRQFDLVGQIRDIYFLPGAATPGVQFTLITEEYLAPATRRARVELDGTTAENFNGPPRSMQVEWPGARPGQAAVTFESQPGGSRENIVTSGPWAMFRLLDQASLRRQSDVRNVVTWKRGAHEASVVIQASSVNHPFGDDLLTRFSCGN